MGQYSAEGLSRLYHVPTIANIAAPTVAELNAGTNLTGFTPRDGFSPAITQNMADTATLADSYDTQTTGTEGGPITLTLLRDNTADTAWNLYVAGGLTGFLAFREGVAASTAWTATQKVQIYPYKAHKPTPAQTAANESRKFTVACAVTSPPDRNATVA